MSQGQMGTVLSHSLYKLTVSIPTVTYVAMSQFGPTNFASTSAALLMHCKTLHKCNYVSEMLCCMRLLQQPNITQSNSMLVHSLAFCAAEVHCIMCPSTQQYTA